jgi:preprotein translocase subunit SecY
MLIETHRIAVEVLRKLEAIDQRVLELERDQQRTQGAVKTLAVLWAVGIAAIMAYFGWKQAGNH